MSILDGLTHSQLVALALALVGVSAWFLALLRIRRRQGFWHFPIVALLVFVSVAPLITLVGAGALPGFPFSMQDLQIFARSWLVASGVTYLVLLWRAAATGHGGR